VDDDARFMKRALELARRAAEMGEVPVGSVVVREGLVVGEGFNLKETDEDPTAHAEIIALRAAARRLGTWVLDDATLFTTCEPCPMCAGAIVQARVRRLVFGCEDPKGGGVVSRYGIGIDGELNHKVELTTGIMAESCADLLTQFFRERREKP